MGKYRNILVAFDGSESSRNALKQAIKLGRAEESSLKVLVVVPSYEGDLEFIGVKDIQSALNVSAEKMTTAAGEIAAAENTTIETIVESGKAFEKIIETAEAKNCDLIVMGRRGVHRIARMLIGSVSSRVIGHTEKDVLIIPKDASLGWENIVLAANDSECSNAAADCAINFAKTSGGSLTVVSAVDLADEFYAEVPQAADQMLERAKLVTGEVGKKSEKEGVKTETTVREGQPYEKILEVVEEKGADLIFMGSHGRAGLAKLFMGSVTEKVVGHSECSVMVVKLKKA